VRRVPARLGDDPIAHPLIQRPAQYRGQQLARVAVAQTGDEQLGDARKLLARLTHREDDGDRLRAQPPRHERERLRRRPVEPLRVVDDAEQRPFTRRLREQVEHGQPHEEAIRHVSGAEAERRAERTALRALKRGLRHGSMRLGHMTDSAGSRGSRRRRP
jgi:hypothetical protein